MCDSSSDPTTYDVDPWTQATRHGDWLRRYQERRAATSSSVAESRAARTPGAAAEPDAEARTPKRCNSRKRVRRKQ